MKEIKLFNRDGANLKLVSEDGNLWELQVDDEHKYILEYMRMGFESDNKTINMIDPSGGPYLSKGQRLNKYYIIDSIIEFDNKFMIHTQNIEI